MFNAVSQPKRAVQHLGSRLKAAAGVLRMPRLAQGLAEDKKGSVAIIFGITSFLVVSMVGGAVDLGRAYSAKHKMQAVTDAAALASASRFVNDENHNATLAVQQGIKYFTASMADEPTASISSTLDEATKTVVSQATMSIKTPFLSMVGIQTITVTSYSEISATENLTGGGSSEVEMALMLDVTGSMGADDGNGKTKLQAMKDASKSLIDVLIPNTGTQHAKIALAPFDAYIRPREADLPTLTGEPLVKTSTTQYQCNGQTTCVNTTCKKTKKGVCTEWNQSCSTVYDTCTSTSTQYQSRCIGERTGADAFTDDAPGAGSMFTPIWKTSASSATSCKPAQSVVPLTTNKTTLKNTIDAFNTGGSTAGHLGTAWAWYLLSPEWAGIFTGSSAPQPYGTPKLKKIAVLMTDGEYNTQYSSGQGDSRQQALALCAAMKAKGVEVYTVGFKLDSQTAIDTLSTCASGSDHAFLAENGDQLTASFKEIAFRSVPIHIAK